MLGTSLSLCVQDIIRGKILIDDVEKIYSGTKFETVEQAIAHYTEPGSYWGNSKEKATRICRELWDSGRIVQIRLTHPDNFAPFCGQRWYENQAELIRVQCDAGYERFARTMFPDAWATTPC